MYNELWNCDKECKEEYWVRLKVNCKRWVCVSFFTHQELEGVKKKRMHSGRSRVGALAVLLQWIEL